MPKMIHRHVGGDAAGDEREGADTGGVSADGAASWPRGCDGAAGEQPENAGGAALGKGAERITYICGGAARVRRASGVRGDGGATSNRLGPAL